MSNIYDYIKKKEGFSATPFWDHKQFTWGYGTPATEGQTISREEADKALRKRVDADRDYVINYGKKHGYDWSDQQVDALTSFTYNLGRGGLDQLTGGGKRDNKTIASKIPLYNKASGQTLPGLVERRNEEAKWFAGEQGGVPPRMFQEPTTSSASQRRRPLDFRAAAQQRAVPAQSFGEAFAAARRAHGGAGGEFNWEGNRYTTNLKEEEDMKYKYGTSAVPPMMRPPMPVQMLRRGSNVVLDEEEIARRAAARAATAGNVSGGRNVPRVPAPAQPYTHPAFDPYSELEQRTTDPLAAPVVEEEEPGWWARQFAPLQGSLTRSWKERHPDIPETYSPPPIVDEEVVSEPVLPPWTNFKGEQEVFNQQVAAPFEPESYVQGLTSDELDNIILQSSPGSIQRTNAEAEKARREDQFGNKIDMPAESFLTPLDRQYQDRILRDKSRLEAAGGVTDVASAQEAIKLDDQQKQFTLDAEITKGQAIQTEQNILNNQINSELSKIDEYNTILNNPGIPDGVKRQVSQVLEATKAEVAPLIDQSKVLEDNIKQQTQTIQELEPPAFISEGIPNPIERLGEVGSVELSETAKEVPPVDTAPPTPPVTETAADYAPPGTVTDGTPPGSEGNPNDIQKDDDEGTVEDKYNFWKDTLGLSSDQEQSLANTLQTFLGIEPQDLTRAMGLYLASRATGASHAGSMRWAGQQVLNQAATRDERERVEAENAEARQEQIDALLGIGYTQEQAEAQVIAGVKPPTTTVSLTGDSKTVYNKDTGKKHRAIKQKRGDSYIWTVNGEPILDNPKWEVDEYNIPNTKEYNTRIKSAGATYTGQLEELRNSFDKVDDGSGKVFYNTELSPKTSGPKIAEWSVQNNIDPERLGGLIEQAYHEMINDTRQDGKKPRAIVPYLNQLVIRELAPGSIDPWVAKGDDGKGEREYIAAGKMAALNQSIREAIVEAQRADPSYTGNVHDEVNNFYNHVLNQWRKLSQEDRDQWQRSATDDVNGFFLYVQDQLRN